MTPQVRDFPALIRWLAETYHAGKFLPIAKRAKISSALVDQWKHGLVQVPRLDSIGKLCAAYDMDLGVIVQLVAQPPSARRRVRRTLACLVAALLLSPVLAPTSEAGATLHNSTSYQQLGRKLFTKLARWLAACSVGLCPRDVGHMAHEITQLPARAVLV